LGAFPRIVHEKRWKYAWLLGLGAILLAFTRMYEGLLFVIPILVLLWLKEKSLRVWGLAGGVAAIGIAFLLYYNYRVTGNALELPYTLHQKQYGYSPYFSFQGLQPETTYRHDNLFNLSHRWEFERWRESRSLEVFPIRGKDWRTTLNTICGGFFMSIVLLVLLIPAWKSRSSSLPFLCAGIVFLGSFLETVYYPHYAAPATAAIFLLMIGGVQQLRKLNFGRILSGRLLSRGVFAFALGIMLVHEGGKLYRHVPVLQTVPANGYKATLEQLLRDSRGGEHVIFVLYTKSNDPHEEWIYNRADIDKSDVIWAHDMGPEENKKLLAYFKGRSFWKMRPDDNPRELLPYEQAGMLPAMAQ
jgi:hypothetical protein